MFSQRVELTHRCAKVGAEPAQGPDVEAVMREAVPNRRYPLATTQAPVGCQYGRAHSETFDGIRRQLEADRESIGGAAVLPVVESPMAQEVLRLDPDRGDALGVIWRKRGESGALVVAGAGQVCQQELAARQRERKQRASARPRQANGRSIAQHTVAQSPPRHRDGEGDHSRGIVGC
jgi:hypothetical protein